MASVVKVCPKCRTDNSTDSVYCKKCGTDLAGFASSGSLTRQVIEKARDEAIERSVAWTFDKVIVPAIAGAMPAIVLWVQDGSRSFWEWLVLTWPLTVAVAFIIVLAAHPLRESGSTAQALMAAGVLWLAAFIGTTFSGTPVNYKPVSAGRFSALVGIVVGFFVAYGFWPFTLSLIAGAIIGYVCLQLVEQNA